MATNYEELIPKYGDLKTFSLATWGLCVQIFKKNKNPLDPFSHTCFCCQVEKFHNKKKKTLNARGPA
jgi:hypothetical protein